MMISRLWLGFAIGATLMLSACSKNDDEGTQVSYQAVVVPPAGALVFRWLSQLKTYSQNNTPVTQHDAGLLATEYGKTLPQGTSVTVVAHFDFPEVNPLSNDSHFCEVQPQGGDDRYWLQCWDLKTGATKLANKNVAASDLSSVSALPRVGDDAASVTERLTNNRSDDASDIEGDTYYVPFKDQNLRVWVSFDKYPDSSQRLGQVAFSRKDGVLDSAMAKAILATELPGDAKPLPVSDVGREIANTVSGLAPGQSAQFFASETLGTKIKKGPCQSSRPEILEVFRESDPSGHLTKLLLMSLYLNLCESPVDATQQ